MINITKGETNIIITSVNQIHVDDDYEINFNNSGFITTLTTKDTSVKPIRYNQFTFEEGLDIALTEGQGYYEIVLNSIIIGKGIYYVRNKDDVSGNSGSEVEYNYTQDKDDIMFE